MSPTENPDPVAVIVIDETAGEVGFKGLNGDSPVIVIFAKQVAFPALPVPNTPVYVDAEAGVGIWVIDLR